LRANSRGGAQQPQLALQFHFHFRKIIIIPFRIMLVNSVGQPAAF
jgi:hypothetical protein